MIQIPNTKHKHYDLEERTLKFTQRIIRYVKKLPKTMINIEIGRQLVRAGGSVGANYIEANEALGRKDFFMRIRISKKEAKESRYWLRLGEPNDRDREVLQEQKSLIDEATELMKIFGPILQKSQ